jgi:hypothetical protein
VNEYQRVKILQYLEDAHPIGQTWEFRHLVPLGMPVVDIVTITGYDPENYRVVGNDSEGKQVWIWAGELRHKVNN